MEEPDHQWFFECAAYFDSMQRRIKVIQPDSAKRKPHHFSLTLHFGFNLPTL